MFELGFGKSIAVVTDQKSFSYDELKRDSETVASHAKAGSVALIVSSDSYDCLLGYIGFLNNDVVPIMLNRTAEPEVAAKIIEQYQPEFIWAPRTYATVFKPNYLPVTAFNSYLLQESTNKDHGAKPYCELAMLLSTSGSTGSKKYVRLSKSNILSNAKSIIEYLEINESERAISTLPLSYTYGLSIVNSHLLAGASIILTGKTVFEKEFWNMLKEHKATSFGGVPYTYSMLRQLRFARMELPSLRYITQAGGKLGRELHEEFAAVCKNKGIDFIVMYGQTEATARISYLPAEYATSKVDSIGVAIPGGEIYLEDEDGQRISRPYVAGELVYKGPNVSLGYAENRNDLALGDIRQGVLKTGDIAECDNDGMYYIVGRKKRFLKIYGNRVSLDELEGVLCEAGLTAAVGGTDDNCRVLLESCGLEAEDARRAQVASEVLQKRTGLHRSSFRVQVVPALPRSESGKIIYTQWNE